MSYRARKFWHDHADDVFVVLIVAFTFWAMWRFAP